MSKDGICFQSLTPTCACVCVCVCFGPSYALCPQFGIYKLIRNRRARLKGRVLVLEPMPGEDKAAALFTADPEKFVRHNDTVGAGWGDVLICCVMEGRSAASQAVSLTCLPAKSAPLVDSAGLSLRPHRT